MNPELIVFTGPMFGGKTSKLLASVDRYQYRNKYVLCFKPEIDDRYDKKSIVTHTNTYKDGVLAVKVGQDILDVVEYLRCADNSEVDIVAVDEVFMIPGVAKSLLELYFRGVTVLASSLQLSYEGKPFDEVSQLLPYATRIEVCPAVCAQCDKDAYYTHRKVSGDETLMIGGVNMYEPLCYHHYKEVVKNVSFG